MPACDEVMVAISAAPHASVERARNQRPCGVASITRGGADIIDGRERREVFLQNPCSKPNACRCANQGSLKRGEPLRSCRAGPNCYTSHRNRALSVCLYNHCYHS